MMTKARRLVSIKNFIKSYVLTYIQLLSILCFCYAIFISVVATAMKREVEDIFAREESLLSLYFFVPFSLGMLLELRQNKLDKGKSTVFGYILGLFIGLSLVASIVYGFIIGTAILLLFFVGCFGGQGFQRYIISPTLKLLRPIVSAMARNIKLIVSYLLLCALTSMVFGVIYAQVQIHFRPSSNLKGIYGLTVHILNSFFLMITFGTVGAKPQHFIVDMLCVVQCLWFSLLTIIFGTLLVKPKKSRQNIPK